MQRNSEGVKTMNEYKRYDFQNKDSFRNAFDTIYGAEVRAKEQREQQQRSQKSVDKAISEEMAKGRTRQEAVMELYANE